MHFFFRELHTNSGDERRRHFLLLLCEFWCGGSFHSFHFEMASACTKFPRCFLSSCFLNCVITTSSIHLVLVVDIDRDQPIKHPALEPFSVGAIKRSLSHIMSGLLPYPFGPPPPPPGQMANSTSARIFVNGMALPAGQPFNQTVAYHQIQRALPSNVQMNFNIDHNSPGIHIHYHHHQVPAGNSLARVHRDRPQWSMPEGASPETKR